MSARRITRSSYRLRRAVEDAFYAAGIPVQSAHVTRFILAVNPAIDAHARVIVEEVVKRFGMWSLDEALQDAQ